MVYMLGSTYATRSPDAFAKVLSEFAGLPESDTLRSTKQALSAHEETHLAFEFLSELSMRARVLRALLPMLNQGQYDRLLSELCVVGVATQPRLRSALTRVGVGPQFYWEDIVTRTMQDGR